MAYWSWACTAATWCVASVLCRRYDRSPSANGNAHVAKHDVAGTFINFRQLPGFNGSVYVVLQPLQVACVSEDDDAAQTRG